MLLFSVFTAIAVGAPSAVATPTAMLPIADGFEPAAELVAPSVPQAPVPPIWVLIPVFNASPFIEACLESVYAQVKHVPSLRVVIADDGSTDGTVEKIYSLLKTATNARYTAITEVITAGNHTGPGHSKWVLTQHLRTHAGANDIAVVVDGDDTLSRSDALRIIAERYRKSKCWMTYGSFSGKWAEQVRPFTWRDAADVRSSPWVYGHPRSFKAHLAQHVVADDFQDANGMWYTKGSERGMLYRMLEVSGARRVQYISSVLYNYRETAINSYKVVSTDLRKQQVASSADKPQSLTSIEVIHVIIASWRRVSYLERVLQSLKAQEGLDDVRIAVHIWNNNDDSNVKRDLTDVVSRVTQATKSRMPLTIDLQHSEHNLKGWARFELTRELLATVPLDYVIFVDDDYYLPADFIAGLWQSRQAGKYAGWFGKNFIDGYWTSNPTITEVIGLKRHDVTSFDYVGTGGALLDASAMFSDILWKCPKQFRDVEDMWLSFVVREHLGYELERYIPTSELKDLKAGGENHATAQWRNLVDKKSAFYYFLKVGLGWKVGKGSVTSLTTPEDRQRRASVIDNDDEASGSGSESESPTNQPTTAPTAAPSTSVDDSVDDDEGSGSGGSGNDSTGAPTPSPTLAPTFDSEAGEATADDEDNTSTVLAIVLPIFGVLGLVGAVVWNKRVKARQGKAPISRASRDNQNFEHHTVDPIPPAIDHGFHVSNPDHAVKRGSSQTYIEAAEDTPVWDPMGTPSPVMNSKELNQSESTEV